MRRVQHSTVPRPGARGLGHQGGTRTACYDSAVMRPETFIVAACIAASVVSAPGHLLAQAPAARGTYTPPKTAWGDPDLEGVWPSTAMVGVPLERPKQFGTRLMLTDAEFKQRETDAAKQAALDTLDFDIEKPPDEIKALGDVGNETSPPPHWLERGEPSRQSSLVVD